MVYSCLTSGKMSSWVSYVIQIYALNCFLLGHLHDSFTKWRLSEISTTDELHKLVIPDLDVNSDRMLN